MQEDLKLTDSQKEQVKPLSDKIDEQRKAQREAFEARRNGGGNPPERRCRGDPPAGETAKGRPRPKAEAVALRGGPQAKNGGGPGPNANGDAAKGADPNGGGRGPRSGNNGNGPNGGGYGFPQARFEQQQQETDTALAKILTKPQRDRIRQIQLQQEGPMAVTKPELQKKLNMSQLQIEQIAMIVDERQQSQRDLFTQGQGRMSQFQTPEGKVRLPGHAGPRWSQDPQFKAEMDKSREVMTQQSSQIQSQSIAMIGKTIEQEAAPELPEDARPSLRPRRSLIVTMIRRPPAAKEKEEAEAAKEAASSKKNSSAKKKTSAKTKPQLLNQPSGLVRDLPLES